MSINSLLKRLLLLLLIATPTLLVAQTRTLSVGPSPHKLSTGAEIAPQFTVAADSSIAISTITAQIIDGGSGHDVLYVSGSLPAGFTSSWDDTSKTLSIVQTSPVANNASAFNTAVRLVAFRPGKTHPLNLARTIHFSVLEKNASLTINGVTHRYGYVPGAVTFTTALTTAATKTYYDGTVGHLTTVTSEAENSVAYSASGSNFGWLAGSDSTTEGTWVWQAGPESGTTLTYFNWGTGQPDNSSNEDYLHLYTPDGKWNDLSLSNAGAVTLVEWSTDNTAVNNISVEGINTNAVANGMGF